MGMNRFFNILPFSLSPIARRRLKIFKNNRRGYYSACILCLLFILSLFAEWIANDKPIFIYYDKGVYFPIIEQIPETEFGGFFETEAVYSDKIVQDLIKEKGFLIWPIIRYSYNSLSQNLSSPAPTAPDKNHLLGTDDEARDVLARIIYGFRISMIFGLTLTIASSIIGVFFGAVQGYFGGWIDLSAQRFIEIWSGLPVLFILIILASLTQPNFWWLLGLMLLFSWTSLVNVVRAEILRARNFDYVLAARALGLGHMAILMRHVLPNAMVATMTFLPFIAAASITTLTSLDFLGFGLPPGSPSLGELLKQGKENLQAPWLGISAFVVIGGQLSLMIFIGEAVRDAFDPQKI